jgi:hypothetical protein
VDNQNIKTHQLKTFVSNIWKYLALIFAGIIAGMVAAIKLIEKPSILNVKTDNFIAEQSQKIRKLKQRGEGNLQDTTQFTVLPSRKEKRLFRRAAKRELRLKRETEKEEQDQKDY